MGPSIVDGSTRCLRDRSGEAALNGLSVKSMVLKSFPFLHDLHGSVAILVAGVSSVLIKHVDHIVRVSAVPFAAATEKCLT